MSGSELGTIAPVRDDPAWQAPTDPLRNVDPRRAARIILREIPLTTIATSWTVTNVRDALSVLTNGQFAAPAQLVDAILADDRVQATLGARTCGLTSQPIKFSPSRVPGVDRKAAAECLDAWRRVWPATMTEPVLSELQQWGIMLGFCPAQILWDTSDEIWIPHLRVFHPRYVYYHWTLRRFVAVTMDGQVPITPGDGHWILHAPYGEHRGWMRGAVRAIAQPWLIRNFAYRDHARWSERHGFPMIVAKTPAADDVDAPKWLEQLSRIGQESVIQAKQGVDEHVSYDVELLEAKDGSWQGFTALIQQCDSAITLGLLFQNLTTEVKEGSFAATETHAAGKQSLIESDGRGVSHTTYTQLTRAFAAVNYGDPDVAPHTEWDVTQIEDRATAAEVLTKFSSAIKQLREAGKEIDLMKLARSLGIMIDDADVRDVAPITKGAP